MAIKKSRTLYFFVGLDLVRFHDENWWSTSTTTCVIVLIDIKQTSVFISTGPDLRSVVHVMNWILLSLLTSLHREGDLREALDEIRERID